MAYEVHAITAITDVPALVGSFAASNGFDANVSNPNKPIITCPGDSNSVEDNMPMQIQALISGTNNQNHEVWWSEANGGSNSIIDDARAIIHSPKLNATSANNPTVSLPTKLHIFGTAVGTTSPFIACVIEYGFNLYRHLYFGKMEARGNYTGREVISACAWGFSSAGNARRWDSQSDAQFLFSAHQSMRSTPDMGGVRIIHVDNPTEWRQFRQGATINTVSPFDEYLNSQVVGGWGDGWNEGYIVDGKSAFAGGNILVPWNLYACAPIIGDTSFIPIGRPPGVRGVNMQDLDPGSQIVVGNETWRVFPAIRKASETSSNVGPFNFPTYETSYYLGYAYLEEDAP